MSSSTSPDADVENSQEVSNLAIAHGVTMGLAFLVLFPTGAVIIRVLNMKQTMLIHAFCQMAGWCLMLAGFGTGMRLGNILHETSSSFHTIAGTFIVAGMLVQPWFGYWHHRRYRVLKRKTVWTHTHVWFGRVLMLLGIANGGVGFSLASGSVAYSQTGMIVYAVFASVAGLVLVGLALWTMTRKEKLKHEDLPLDQHE